MICILSSIGCNYHPFRNKSRYIAFFHIFICELYIVFYVKHKHFEYVGFSLIRNLKKEVYTEFNCYPRRCNHLLFKMFLFSFHYWENIDPLSTINRMNLLSVWSKTRNVSNIQFHQSMTGS